MLLKQLVIFQIHQFLSIYSKKIIKLIFFVKDNGIGIDEKKISKLFEPYYTTKDKGTGLGLSIVKKIIEDHSGNIKIEKNKDMAGTTTLITFEILMSSKVLIIDDEKDICFLISEIYSR